MNLYQKNAPWIFCSFDFVNKVVEKMGDILILQKEMAILSFLFKCNICLFMLLLLLLLKSEVHILYLNQILNDSTILPKDKFLANFVSVKKSSDYI